MQFKENDTIIFIGDSITEDGRFEDSEGLGQGYVRLLHDYFMVTQPELKVNVVNKGVGGNRVTDLEARWQTDVIDEQPDWLSVSIGINDVWRQLDSPELAQVYPEDFEIIYRKLLKETREKTQARLILMEATVIDEDLTSEGNQRLIPYHDIVRKLAKEFDALLIPENVSFQKVIKAQPGKPLTTDGVHMTSIGRMLMAMTWAKAFAEA
ncbi:lysophospholipase L1-like esterase [Pullulanibacillus pueri]|uniref:Lipase n=1 Tax=Pullulanibacillus pueri TaxID=1437324 RepID=A0A8J3EKX5_9BACL|nr:SGNH/GDSL hydrolase family protein [Pullulanibacillus pueri]MBM7681834.1 lysophospholipase L1-like esterase [Pullulanibacillus pueri]GGH76272.1 lipase [Pullulanibacillus pueri]